MMDVVAHVVHVQHVLHVKVESAFATMHAQKSDSKCVMVLQVTKSA